MFASSIVNSAFIGGAGVMTCATSECCQPGTGIHTRLSGVMSAKSRSTTLRVKPGRSPNCTPLPPL